MQDRGPEVAAGVAPAGVPLPLDPVDDLRVDAEAGAEREVAVVGAAEVDDAPAPARSASSSSLVASTGDGDMPRARAKTLALPPGTMPQRRSLMHEAVDHLVDGAVAAEHDDELDPSLPPPREQLGGVAAVRRSRPGRA